MAYSAFDPANQSGYNPFANEDFLMSQPVLPSATGSGVADAFGFGASSGGGGTLPDWGTGFSIGAFDPTNFPIFSVFNGTAGATQTPVPVTADQSGSSMLDMLTQLAAQYFGKTATAPATVQPASLNIPAQPKIFGLPMSTVLLIGGALGASYLLIK